VERYKDLSEIRKRKVLFIAGSNANYTDVKSTFKSILKAIDQEYLSMQEIELWFRRAGPNWKDGFKLLEERLTQLNIRYRIFGPETPLTEIVNMALPVKE